MRSLVLVLLALAGPAAAQQVDCATAQAQQELNFCAEQDWLRADEQLNAHWQRAKAMAQSLDQGLPRAQQGIWQALLDGQRAWITYRDKTCEAAGGFMRGGSAEPLLVYGCLERLTWARVDELQLFSSGM